MIFFPFKFNKSNVFKNIPQRIETIASKCRWIFSFKEKNISLKPEETKILSLVVNPSLSTQSKNYPVKLILKSGNLTITEDFDVIITSKQKELMKYFYYVITTIIILLALILFFIQKNKKSKTNKKTKKLRKHKRKKNTKKSIREKNK